MNSNVRFSFVRISKFWRTWTAFILFAVFIILYICLPRLPDPYKHLLLTLAAVMCLHVLDRLLLYRDIKESFDERINKLEDSIDKLLQCSDSLNAMINGGIVRIYSSRTEASDDIAQDLSDPKNTKIQIIGISLNDFIRGNNEILGGAWGKIRKRVEDAIIHNENIHLHIKILLIDPRCYGARLRAFGQIRVKWEDPTSLARDVEVNAKELAKLESNVKEKKKEGYLPDLNFECKLYRLPPIIFLCHMDSVSYTQQYHFWALRRDNTPIPVIKYRKITDAYATYPMHEELNEHFEWIWNKASISASSLLDEEAVGIDDSMNQLGAVNVYTDSDKARDRILHLLKKAEKKVSIMGITLRSFFRRENRKEQELFDIICDLVNNDIDVTVLLLDPKCDQAKYRSYREQLSVNPNMSFDEYKNSRLYEQSLLYLDTDQVINNIKTGLPELISKKKLLLYETAPACFMLQIDDIVLAEQYLYGKATNEERPEDVSPILGKDMPLFEYSMSIPPLYKDIKSPRPFDLFIDHLNFVLKQAKPVY